MNEKDSRGNFIAASITKEAEEFPWQDPPEPKEPKIERAKRRLQSQPGAWALIDTAQGLRFGPWWLPLQTSDDYEIHVERLDNAPAGRREIYAKYIGPPDEGDDGNVLSDGRGM